MTEIPIQIPRMGAVMYQPSLLFPIGGLTGRSFPEWLAYPSRSPAQPPGAASSPIELLSVDHHSEPTSAAHFANKYRIGIFLQIQNCPHSGVG